MRTKKRRLSLDDQANSSARTSCVSFTSLPIEIIAEILLYTCSPPTVLSVSRTCSFLYRSLAQNPESSFIWRRVREALEPIPLPDPGDGWKKSEADYAAFVFGGGACEVCQKPTRAMYLSFAARIRLCRDWHCRKKYLKEFLISVTSELLPLHDQSLWVLPVESVRCLYPSRQGASFWPDGEIFVRKRDWVELQGRSQAYKGAEQARAGHERLVAPTAVGEEDQERERALEFYWKIWRLPQIMEISISLLRWKWNYDSAYRVVKMENDEWTEILAEAEGWDLGDLVVSQAYGSLKRRKNFLLEGLRLSDVSPIHSAIESELRALQVRRKRQKAEVNYRKSLTEVKKIYKHMRCGTLGVVSTKASGPSDPWILPPLSVFCTLPCIRAFKGSPDPSLSLSPPGGTSSGIGPSLSMSLVETDVNNWLIPVEKHLMALLDYPKGWQSTNPQVVSPLRRVTARFFCRQCGEGKVRKGYQRERCLDFRGVCSHVCVAAQGERHGRQQAPEEREIEANVDEKEQDKGGSKCRKKGGSRTSIWRVDVFEKDEKAIYLIKTILNLTGLSEKSPAVNTALEELGGTIRCVTCRGWIVMDFDTAIGHAHRHESMQIQLMPTSAPSHAGFLRKDASGPNGSTNRFVDRSRLAFERGNSELLLGPTFRGRNLCKKVNYGCKHCFDAVEDIVVGCKGSRAMDFNALRSHVKGKHGIQEICDEDFFCYNGIQDVGGEK